MKKATAKALREKTYHQKRDIIEKLQEENKQLKIYKDLYEKLRKQFDEYNKYNKKQKADFIKKLKELLKEGDGDIPYSCGEYALEINKLIKSLEKG